MFIYKTELRESKIDGMGVFALEFIPCGSVIWKFQKNFDVRITETQIKQLPIQAIEYIQHYGYYSKKEGGFILCMDNAKYTNHSSIPNMRMVVAINSIATKDINIGEEITEDYFVFDELAHDKLNPRHV